MRHLSSLGLKPTLAERIFHSRGTFDVLSLFLQQALEVDALGALDGHAQGTVPDELDEGSEGTADTEGDGVVQGLLEAVVVEEDTRGGVDVGVGVLGLRDCQSFLILVTWK